MKKTLLFMTVVMTAVYGRAGTFRAQGSFIESIWHAEVSCITPQSGMIAASAPVDLTAVPEAGYDIYGWYYRTSQSQLSTDQDLSDWTTLSDTDDDKTTCTIPASSTFTSGNNFIALNLRYVRYSLSFNYNGGSGASSSMTGLCVTNSVTLPVPDQRAGYEFVNWKGENGSEFSAGEPVAPGVDLGLAHSDTNFTLTAQWTPHTMSISYVLDGGSSGADHPASATFGEAFKISAPTKTGYDFIGWSVQDYDSYTAKYGTSSSGEPPASYSSLASGGRYPSNGGDVWFLSLTPEQGKTVTLTANWQAKTYNVIFSISGARYSCTTNLTVTYDQALPNVPVIPEYGNADFMGFYTQPNGQGEKYWNSDGSPYVAIWTNDVDNMMFYEFKGNLRKLLTFHGNGGIPATVTTNALVGATYGSVMPSVAWAEGWYDFAGWYTSPSGGEEVSAETVIENAPGDIDLYAHWEVAKYYVRFDGNGATNLEEMTVQPISFDVETPLSPNEYGKTGYTFTGWTNSASIHFADGAVVSNLLDVAGTTCTVYAVWSPNEYYIRFDPNGGEGTALLWTNRYDTATNCPPADTFTRSGYWKFSCWSNTLDGATYAPGDASLNLTNLTAEPYATVVVNAVWETTLSKLSLAMHCDNLDWRSQASNSGNLWIDRWGSEFGYESSGSCVSQENRSGQGLQVGVSTNGTLSFYCKMESGNEGVIRFWIASLDNNEFAEAAAYDTTQNITNQEVQVAGGGGWTKIELNVPSCDTTNYVNIANRRLNDDTLYIDMMTWTPAGSSIEPTEKDAVVFSGMTIDNGSFSLTFTPNPSFAYNLHGTNELTAALSLWPVILTTNGTEEISITLPVKATEPKMFYYMETTAK